MEHASLSKPAPGFAVADIFGGLQNLADDHGKVVLLYLWATWCPSCQAETAALMDLQRRYRSSGLVIIACSRDQDPELVRRFYRQYQLNYPVVMTVPDVQRFFGTALGIRDEEVLTEVPIPTSILLGRDGRINSVYVGRGVAALSPALNQLLEDKAVLVGASPNNLPFLHVIPNSVLADERSLAPRARRDDMPTGLQRSAARQWLAISFK